MQNMQASAINALSDKRAYYLSFDQRLMQHFKANAQNPCPQLRFALF